MIYSCGVTGWLLLAASVAQALPPHARPAVDFEWVRGTIVAASPASLTLRRGNRTYDFVVDGTTTPQVSASSGSVVDVHYAKSSGKRRAVFIFAATAAAPRSRVPSTGDSTAGVVGKRRDDVSIVGRGVRSITIESRTSLLDEQGRPIAKGRREIAQRLSAGDRVLATWYDVIFSRHDLVQPAGDPRLNNSIRRYALEIRILPADTPTTK